MEYQTQSAKDQTQEAPTAQPVPVSSKLDSKEARRQLGWDLMQAQRQWRSR
jgi:hypothetical protein